MADPSQEEVQAFASGANAPNTETISEKVVPDLDPKGKHSHSFLLRLNEYELQLIRQIAADEDRSMHKVLKRLLIPALEKKAQELE